MKSVKIYILQFPVPYQEEVLVFLSRAKAEAKKEEYFSIYDYVTVSRLKIQEVEIPIPKKKKRDLCRAA